MYVSAYYYTCVLILQYVHILIYFHILLYLCPHATIHLSSYYHIAAADDSRRAAPRSCAVSGEHVDETCGSMPYADVCRRMLPYDAVCCRMLTAQFLESTHVDETCVRMTYLSHRTPQHARGDTDALRADRCFTTCLTSTKSTNTDAC
jgi:hypothetical protein